MALISKNCGLITLLYAAVNPKQDLKLNAGFNPAGMTKDDAIW